MGKKGMKSFMKAVSHSDAVGPIDGQADGGPGAFTTPHSTPNDAEPSRNGTSGSTTAPHSDDVSTMPAGETRGQMIQRHKREMLAHKKTISRQGKKSKDELAALMEELEMRHAKELHDLEDRLEGEAAQAVESLAISASEVTHSSEEVPKKVSHARKRREKLAQKELEREARIAEEKALQGPSTRDMESSELAALLQSMQLQMREIRADGHCLYRALEDQLGQSGGPELDYQALRTLAAKYIREHADEFLPFIMQEEGDLEGENVEEFFKSYCDSVEHSAVWGGQIELNALAHALRKQINVHSVGMPVVTLGSEYIGAGPLSVCFLRHAFGLGEHYNSVEVLPVKNEGSIDD